MVKHINLIFSHAFLTLYHTIRALDNLQQRSLLKTLWEKEKMLVTSIFSFSHHVFNPIKDKNHHFKYFNVVVCNAFNLVRSKNLSFGKGLKGLSPKYQASHHIVIDP